MMTRSFLPGRHRAPRTVRMPHLLVASLALGLTGCASSPPQGRAAPDGEDGSTAVVDRPPLVQAGAPGEDSRPYDATSLEDVEGVEHTPADVAFMQGMIHHHAQALEMTALIAERTRNEAIRQMGLRMEISQADEIRLMERWLRDRGKEVPRWREAAGGHGAHHGVAGKAGDEESTDRGRPDQGGSDQGRPMMPGMLTQEQMARLEAARDEAFDRLFLELMIQHHEGALVMVQELMSTPGAGQESQTFQLAHEVDADQAIEIRRMRRILATLP